MKGREEPSSVVASYLIKGQCHLFGNQSASFAGLELWNVILVLFWPLLFSTQTIANLDEKVLSYSVEPMGLKLEIRPLFSDMIGGCWVR